MALEAPELVYARMDEEPTLARALRLAREIEAILEDAPSVALGNATTTNGAHSTRIARAVAASLVDELHALLRGTRKNGAA